MKAKTIIHEMGLIIMMTVSFPSFGQNNEVYSYPMYPGDEKWNSCKNTQERMNALQLPQRILKTATTDRLLSICLDYPFINNYLYFNNYQDGFSTVLSQFNGIQELLKRTDLSQSLLERLKNEKDKEKWTTLLFLFIEAKKHFNMIYNDRESLLEEIDRMAKESIDIPFHVKDAFHFAIQKIYKEYGKSYTTKIQSREYGDNYEYTTTMTPKGHIVNDCAIYHGADYNITQQTYLANYILNGFPNNNIVGPASMKYNCHGYAWHMYPDNLTDYLWIGFENYGEVYKYWEDSSYIAVPEPIATHVKYFGDHSAIRITSNLYISKWRDMSLVQHTPNDTPYGQPFGFYRLAPFINGNKNICFDNETYTIVNMPPLSTIEWSVDGCLSILSGQGTDTIVVKGLCAGFSTLCATIKYNGTIISTITKRISIGAPPLGLSLEFRAPNGELGIWSSPSTTQGGTYFNTFTIEEDETSNAAYSRVEAELYKISDDLLNMTLVQTWNNISTTNAQIQCLPIGWYYFQLRGYNNCGVSDWLGQEVEVVDFETLDFYIECALSANTITINIHDENLLSNNEESKSTNKYLYDIQLWRGQTLMKKVSTCNTVNTLSLSNYPSGFYILKVSKKTKEASYKFYKN